MEILEILQKYWRYQDNFKKINEVEILNMMYKKSSIVLIPVFKKRNDRFLRNLKSKKK